MDGCCGALHSTWAAGGACGRTLPSAAAETWRCPLPGTPEPAGGSHDAAGPGRQRQRIAQRRGGGPTGNALRDRGPHRLAGGGPGLRRPGLGRGRGAPREHVRHLVVDLLHRRVAGDDADGLAQRVEPRDAGGGDGEGQRVAVAVVVRQAGEDAQRVGDYGVVADLVDDAVEPARRALRVQIGDQLRDDDLRHPPNELQVQYQEVEAAGAAPVRAVRGCAYTRDLRQPLRLRDILVANRGRRGLVEVDGDAGLGPEGLRDARAHVQHRGEPAGALAVLGPARDGQELHEVDAVAAVRVRGAEQQPRVRVAAVQVEALQRMDELVEVEAAVAVGVDGVEDLFAGADLVGGETGARGRRPGRTARRRPRRLRGPRCCSIPGPGPSPSPSPSPGPGRRAASAPHGPAGPRPRVQLRPVFEVEDVRVAAHARLDQHGPEPLEGVLEGHGAPGAVLRAGPSVAQPLPHEGLRCRGLCLGAAHIRGL